MEKSRNYHIKMPAEGYEALQAIADDEKRLLASVIREALEEYTKRHGRAVSFEIERGGYRARKADAARGDR